MPETVQLVPVSDGWDSDSIRSAVLGEAFVPPPVTEYPAGQFAVAEKAVPFGTVLSTPLAIVISSGEVPTAAGAAK